MTASLTVSIDLELAWGNWDNITPAQMTMIDNAERSISARLLQLFDTYEVPVTWAFVAALLDHRSAQGRPGSERLWYAPDVIDSIVKARVQHDIGSHGGRHIYFDRVSADEAEDDIKFAHSVHSKSKLPFTSFVFPRNLVGKHKLLADAGVRVYRGQDEVWHESVRNRSRVAGRLANLADKILSIAPPSVAPKHDGRLINLPGSMLFFGRNGLRKMVSRGALERQLSNGLRRAESAGNSFHLWFHPSNFYYRTEEQFEIFEGFLRKFAERRDRSMIVSRPMASFSNA